MKTLRSEFRPTEPQKSFFRSNAFVRAYGGAMGGGKSRAMCEVIFNYLLEYPGCTALIARDKHTSIINSTKKTMLEQVVPSELVNDPKLTKSKASGGEDYIKFWNGSSVHFVGMDDPYRWYSSEISIFALDEAQEISNADVDKVVRLITRVRERCQSCIRAGEEECDHMPHKVMLSFNPANPDHWLQEWFIVGSEPTPFGTRKPELTLPGADEAIGDAEFVRAKATDNPYLSKKYMASLKGLPAHLRRRYLEGLWEYIDGDAFFDADSLQYYMSLASTVSPTVGTLTGDIQQDVNQRVRKIRSKDPIRVKIGSGPLQIFKPPVKGDKPHRYVIGVDSSSGRSSDWTAMQVVDVEEFEQVAELQLKIPPNEAAEWAYRLGRIYNDAKIVCEVTGGWGFAVDQHLRELKYPDPYTRRVIDRLTKRFTDKLGFDTTSKTRPLILAALEEAIREREFGLYGMRTVVELSSFVMSERGKAEAQPGAHDDLCMSLALAVYVRGTLPKEMRRQKQQQYQPSLTATGW